MMYIIFFKIVETKPMKNIDTGPEGGGWPPEMIESIST
jgi:hypothetical protein